jgi:PKD repeat protein
VFVGWYVDFEVRFTGGPPVSGAKVNFTSMAKDSYKNNFETIPELNLTYPEYSTDQNGQINNIICYQKLMTSDDTFTFNPYKIDAQKSNIGVDSIEISILKSKKITLQLSQLDLSATSISIPNPYNRVPINEYFIVSAEIKNSGIKDFYNVGLQFRLTGHDIDYSYLSKLTNLPADSSITVEMEEERLKIIGKYTVEVIVDYDDNIFEVSEENNRLQKDLIVTTRPIPILKANATKVYIGENLTFYANESNGPEPILEYIFNFDDGNIISQSDKHIIEHKFNKPGTYMVSLSVKDIYGITSLSNATTIIEVVAKPKPVVKPIARFSISPKEGDVTTTFTFDPSESTTSENAFVTIYNWEFGDNTSNSWEKPSHQYTDDDIYTITLVIKDTNGLTSEKYSQQLKIRNIGPSAELSADRINITEGDQILFNASETYDPDDTLKEQLTRFIWYFGDGEEYFETPIKYDDGKYDKLATHIYMEPGEYNVTLVVYDDNGASNQTSIKITVNPLDKKKTDESDPLSSSPILLIGSILLILLIVFISLLFLVFRRKKHRTKSEDAIAARGKSAAPGYYQAAQSSYDVEDYSTPSGTIAADAKKMSTGSATGKKGKKKQNKGKLKHVYGLERSSSLRPMEVEVEVPDEKVVHWKGEQSALNSTLTMEDVDIVTNGELSTAPIIGTDDEDLEDYEEYEQFEELEDFKDVGDGSYEDLQPSDEYQEEFAYEDEPEAFEPVEPYSETPEIPDEQPMEFYEEPIAETPETEPVLEESDEDKVVFEFEDDGVTKTAELDAVTEDNIGEQLNAQSPKKKEKLIAIPGIGFVTKEELQKAISGKDGTLDSSDIDSDEYSYQNGTPLKLDDTFSMGLESDSQLRCKWCNKPISGKYIKIRRNDDQGLNFGVLGPFCSQECATKFGK